ncbi:MAG: 30S ribosomal protein S18 [Dehalococcoidia bacterium]|nr:30S ribosomal protein S18 [Dehalococcoidia bacterium]
MSTPRGGPARRPTAGGGGGAGGAGARPRGRGRRFFPPRRKVCGFCVEHVPFIDYKDAIRLRRYLAETARIDPRRKTGTCAPHQRALTTAIKRARHLALLPYVGQMAREPFFRDRRMPPMPPGMPPREQTAPGQQPATQPATPPTPAAQVTAPQPPAG